MVKSGPEKYIIIAAAGSGSRFGSSLPKQFCLLCGKPVICHAIDSFREALPEGRIIVAIAPDREKFWISFSEKYGLTSLPYVTGGATRAETIAIALDKISSLYEPAEDALVLVHDAARPLVDKATILNTIEPFASFPYPDGAIPCIPLADTVRHIEKNGNSHTLERSALRAIQTPQTFRFRSIHKAYRTADISGATDDASVMEAAGMTEIILTPGNPDNFKITEPGDILKAEALLRCNH